MQIKVDKDISKFINGVCKDQKINRTKYINRLLWNGIKQEISDDEYRLKPLPEEIK